MSKIKTGLQVKIVKGKDAGKEGEVLKVVYGKTRAGTSADKIVVKGINLSKKHIKPNPQLNTAGGIIEIERPISISNARLVGAEKKATKKPAKKAEKVVETKEEN